MIQGQLDRIDVKETQFGTMYNLVVAGKTYGAGKFPPKNVVAGDYVQFDATNKPGTNYWNLAPGTLSKIDRPAGVAAATPARSYATAGAPDRRQETISKQAALNSALNHVANLIAADALPVAKTVKSDKKADLITAITEHYTQKFYNQSTGETFEFPDQDTKDLASLEGADGNWEE